MVAVCKLFFSPCCLQTAKRTIENQWWTKYLALKMRTKRNVPLFALKIRHFGVRSEQPQKLFTKSRRGTAKRSLPPKVEHSLHLGAQTVRIWVSQGNVMRHLIYNSMQHNAPESTGRQARRGKKIKTFKSII